MHGGVHMSVYKWGCAHECVNGVVHMSVCVNGGVHMSVCE